jgi:hypothetical protein
MAQCSFPVFNSGKKQKSHGDFDAFALNYALLYAMDKVKHQYSTASSKVVRVLDIMQSYSSKVNEESTRPYQIIDSDHSNLAKA